MVAAWNADTDVSRETSPVRISRRSIRPDVTTLRIRSSSHGCGTSRPSRNSRPRVRPTAAIHPRQALAVSRQDRARTHRVVRSATASTAGSPDIPTIGPLRPLWWSRRQPNLIGPRASALTRNLIEVCRVVRPAPQMVLPPTVTTPSRCVGYRRSSLPRWSMAICRHPICLLCCGAHVRSLCGRRRRDPIGVELGTLPGPSTPHPTFLQTPSSPITNSPAARPSTAIRASHRHLALPLNSPARRPCGVRPLMFHVKHLCRTSCFMTSGALLHTLPDFPTAAHNELPRCRTIPCDATVHRYTAGIEHRRDATPRRAPAPAQGQSSPDRHQLCNHDRSSEMGFG